MEENIIDPNNPEKQLYYPPHNYIIQSISPQEDEYFKDLTDTNSNEDEHQNISCC